MRLPHVATSAALAIVITACGSDSPRPTPTPTPTPTSAACAAATSAYAVSVVESWIPAPSLAQNTYSDPRDALGAPNVGGFGPRNYTGFVSLGFGGHVTVDLGGCIADQQGNDLRVYQAVSNEPVSVYVSTSPEGPFTLLRPFFKDCPTSSADHLAGNRNAGFCDFDLASAAVEKARYIRVEDAELYPTPGDTPSEGADLDAVQALGMAGQ